MSDWAVKIDVALKAWDTVQSIARSCDESANKLRVLALSGWGLLLGFAWTSAEPFVYLIALVLLVLACFSEAMIRQVQYAFIRRSFEIERALQAFMVDDFEGFIAVQISTHVPAMTWHRFWRVFSRHRIAVWGPYAIGLVATLLAYFVAP